MFKKLFFLMALTFILTFLLIGITTPVMASYPERNIKVILHVSPGGGTDTMIRLVTKFMSEKLGVNFVIEDYSGAGGQIGYTALSMAEPDGYTIGTITTMSSVTHELTRENLAYSLRDSFAFIGRIQFEPSAVVVPLDSPYKSIDDLIAYAKENPGEINWGGTSLWGTHHVHLVLLQNATGIKMIYIPFDGVAETRAAILGKHIDVAASLATEWLPLIKEGKLRCLAIASNKRMDILPEVPTYKELGYDIEIGSMGCIAAPAGTPEEYIQILTQTLKEVLEDPNFLVEAEKIGIKPSLGYFLDGKDIYNLLIKLQDSIKKILEEAN